MAKARSKKQPAIPKPKRSALVPRIKHRNFLKALKTLKAPADQMPYIEPLVGDLVVAYAFDQPGFFQMANQQDIRDLGLAPDEVRPLSLANLRKKLKRVAHVEHGPVQRLVTGKDLEACTLLGTAFWNDIAGQLGDEVVAAVPSRDVVLICGSRSKEGIAALRLLAKAVMADETTHGLTTKLIAWRGEKWVPFSKPLPPAKSKTKPKKPRTS